AAIAPFLARWSRGTVVYDSEALSSLREARIRELRGSPVNAAQLETLLRAELEPARASSCISTVSAEEGRHIERIVPRPVRELGFACDIRTSSTPFTERRGLLFVGAVVDSADSPNTDALTWFLEEVYPSIQKRMNDRAIVHVAGACDEGVRRRLTRPGVTFAGTTPNLDEAYDSARVFVAATRFAAGLPLKVYEAAARGVPIIASSLIARLVGWHPGTDLAVADEPDDFAELCVSLHADQKAWQQLRQNALERVRTDCSRERFSAQLRDVITTALGDSGPPDR
ncbi:MAG: glycosyltransferase family 4 protein, partial [Vicinamibacteria bacterium]